MATVDEVFRLVKYRANKSGFDGNISPADFNLLFPRAEIRYFNQEYAQYAKTQRISDTLSRFMSDPTTITIDGAGKYIFPNDMLHVDAITVNYQGVQYPVVKVEKDRVGAHTSSKVEPPTSQFPIYTQYKTFLQFYPLNLSTASLVYLKKPTATFWNYTLVNNRAVYNPVGSVDPQWNDTDIDNIIYKVLMDLGVNMKDGELLQFSQVEQKTEI